MAREILPYVKVLLLFGLLGLIIGIVLLMLGRWIVGSRSELAVCIVTCSIGFAVVCGTERESFKDIWPFYVIIGLVVSILIFGVSRIITWLSRGV
jgi:hypothetical protein